MKRAQLILLFVFLYVFRVLFGLSHQFFGSGEVERDALQTYLIGLKFYTTGLWPFFGPDQYLLNTGYHAQVPGALEGLAAGLPFYLLPIPEAPFLFLNLLSLSVLALLAFYICRRLPNLSFPFVLVWISLLPWTLNFSTHVFNPSYVLFGSVLFFVGFFEALPTFTTGWFSPVLAFALMGFGMGWDMQFHLSWVLLTPVALLAFMWRIKEKQAGWKELAGGIGGWILPFLFLLPTLLNYGFGQGKAGIAHAGEFLNFKNVSEFWNVLGRYFSFPCFEIPRFIGSGTGERLQFFKDAPWLWAPGVFLILLGWLQPLVLLFAGWVKEPPKGTRFMAALTLAGFVWVWVCFWFTSNGPAAHMYYLFFPLVTVYFFYLWNWFSSVSWWNYFAAVCVAVSLWFQTGFMIHQYRNGNSLESDRGKVVQAIEKKDYRLLSERRPWPVFY